MVQPETTTPAVRPLLFVTAITTAYSQYKRLKTLALAAAVFQICAKLDIGIHGGKGRCNIQGLHAVAHWRLAPCRH
mgnify:CR=1 FL=1